MKNRHNYEDNERFAIIMMCVEARDFAFTEACHKVLLKLQPGASILQVPMLIASRLGTLESGCIVPQKRSSNNAAIMKKNLDLAGWNLGKCTMDLVNIAYTCDLKFDGDGRLYFEDVDTVLEQTSAKNLLYNHVLETCKELDMIYHGYTMDIHWTC